MNTQQQSELKGSAESFFSGEKNGREKSLASNLN